MNATGYEPERGSEQPAEQTPSVGPRPGQQSVWRTNTSFRPEGVDAVARDLPTQPRRALFIGTDRHDLETFRFCATHEGFAVDVASNSSDAIRLVTTHQYSIVVSCAALAHADGVSMLARVGGHQKTSALLLAVDEPDSVTGLLASADAAHIDGILRVPWTRDSLAPALVQADNLSRRRQLKANAQETKGQVRVLLLEDDDGDAVLTQRYLAKDERNKYDVTRLSHLRDGLIALERSEFDVGVVDLSLPDARGLDSVIRLRDSQPSLPLIVLSGLEDEVVELEALNAGAQDFLSKSDINGRSLRRALRYAIQRKRSLEELSYIARHDSLTGLPNRASFNEALDRTIASARRRNARMSVLFIDLDRFKEVNDTLGHEIGDLLLVEVASRLRTCVRENETVARLGGDEFTIILENLTSDDDIAPVASRVIRAVRAPLQLNGHQVHTSASIGIAIYPENGSVAGDLVKSADIAMYRAKEKGKNNYQFFSREAQDRIMNRVHLDQALRDAVSQREFTLHYQPQVDSLGRTVVGAEALIRWDRPDVGMMSPGEFLPLLEQSGLIFEITGWVLKTATAQAANWSLPDDATVSINIPSRYSDHPSLLRLVQDALEESGLPASKLELELTEESMIHDNDQTRRNLTALQKLGVRIALDDFGAGYSALWTLDRFPLDILKIDRTLVRDVGFDTHRTALFDAILGMAHDHGLQVVAEGVETVDQARAAHRCDRLQGFFFSEPMEPSQLDAWRPDAQGVRRS